MTTALIPSPSWRSWRTYSDVASLLDTALCGYGSCRGIGDHETGWTAYGMTAIHWRDRQLTKRGLRRFLKLVAKSKHVSLSQSERFVELYESSRMADYYGSLLGVRFPRSLTEQDRAKVRFWMNRWNPTKLDREFREQRELLRRIRRWARP